MSTTSPLSVIVVFSSSLLLRRTLSSSLCEMGDLGRVPGLEGCVDGGSEGGFQFFIASSLARSSAMMVCPLDASSLLSATSP